MWRAAIISDDEQINKMSLALYEEDPATKPVTETQIRQTLEALRMEPTRGMAAVMEVNGSVAGYALLIAYWSNEFGGEIVVIDELYIRPNCRSQGHGSELFSVLSGNSLWRGNPVALELDVTPQNQRAADLYRHLGFRPSKNRRMQLLLDTESGSIL